jgi:hypothetical protein
MAKTIMVGGLIRNMRNNSTARFKSGHTKSPKVGYGR